MEKTEDKPKKEKKEKKEKKVVELIPKSIKLRLTFEAPLLGTAPANPEIYADFIASKSADAEKLEDEIKSLPAEELEQRGKTVFHRTEDGKPMLYDYQVKGMIKEAFSVFTEFGYINAGNIQIGKYTSDRIVDNFIFVYPREIPLQMPEGAELDECVRPLRGKTQQGPRVALACSERAPRGTVIDIIVEWLNPGLEKHVINALDYGAKKGIGQWRNSGMGRFKWCVVE